MTLRFWLCLVVGSIGLPAPAGCGVIRGTVHLPPAASDASAKRTMAGSNVHGLPEPAAPRRLVIDAVVYVEHVPATAESIIAHARRVPATLAQFHRAFVPRVLSIAAGDTVAAPNFDPIYHDVFSLSPIKGRFALPPLPPGPYTVGVWPPDLRGQRREVRIPAQGDLVLDVGL